MPTVLRASAIFEVGAGCFGGVVSGAMEGSSPAEVALSLRRIRCARPAAKRPRPAHFRLGGGRALTPPRRLPREAALGQGLQIVGPELVLGPAELIEIGPGEDAGIVEVVEFDADGVIAHRLQRQDPDMGA